MRWIFVCHYFFLFWFLVSAAAAWDQWDADWVILLLGSQRHNLFEPVWSGWSPSGWKISELDTIFSSVHFDSRHLILFAHNQIHRDVNLTNNRSNNSFSHTISDARHETAYFVERLHNWDSYLPLSWCLHMNSAWYLRWPDFDFPDEQPGC